MSYEFFKSLFDFNLNVEDQTFYDYKIVHSGNALATLICAVYGNLRVDGLLICKSLKIGDGGTIIVNGSVEVGTW
jgi:hypothetical protein